MTVFNLFDDPPDEPVLVPFYKKPAGWLTCKRCNHDRPPRFKTCPKCMDLALRGLDTSTKVMEGK